MVVLRPTIAACSRTDAVGTQWQIRQDIKGQKDVMTTNTRSSGVIRREPRHRRLQQIVFSGGLRKRGLEMNLGDEPYKQSCAE